MRKFLILSALIIMGAMLGYLFRKESYPPPLPENAYPLHFTFWQSVEAPKQYHTRSLALVEDGSFYYWQRSHLPMFVGDGNGRYDLRGTYTENETDLTLRTDLGSLTLSKAEFNNSPVLKLQNTDSLTHPLEVESWILEPTNFQRLGGFEFSGLPQNWGTKNLTPQYPHSKALASPQ